MPKLNNREELTTECKHKTSENILVLTKPFYQHEDNLDMRPEIKAVPVC